MIKSIFFCVLVLMNGIIFSQITSGSVEPEKNKKEKESKEKIDASKDSLTGTNFYFGGIYHYTYRKFEDQSPSGNYYSEISAQENGFSGGFNAGLIVDFNDWLKMDIGITYFGHAEKYFYQDSLTDSTYNYRNSYQQIGIPLRLRLSYGEKFQIYGSVGITPVNIVKLRKDAGYSDTSGTAFELERVFTTDGFDAFNLMLSAGIGFVYQMRQVGFYIAPEYRRHLLNTYQSKVIGMNHKMFSMAVNVGMILKF